MILLGFVIRQIIAAVFTPRKQRALGLRSREERDNTSVLSEKFVV